MAEVPDPQWEKRIGLVALGPLNIREAFDALTGSIPTLVHATRFCEAMRESLGERAVATGDAGRVLLHACDPADPEWLVPEPLVDLAIGEAAAEMPFNLRGLRPEPERPPDPQPARPPDIAPRGPGMRDGRLRIAEGPSSFVVEYGDRGLVRDRSGSAGDPATRQWHPERPFMLDPTARPPNVGPVSALLHPALGRVARTPSHVADLFDQAAPVSACPMRVLVPPRSPMGIRDVWLSSIFYLRGLLFDVQPPDGARVLVADALGCQAVSWGSTRGETLASWRKEVERVHFGPRPAPPIRLVPLDRAVGETPEREGGGTTEVIPLAGRPRREDDPPPGSPRNVPAGMIAIPPLPRAESRWTDAGFTRWRRILGRHGVVSHVLAREDEHGWTMVGEGVLDLVNPSTIDAEIGVADRTYRGLVEENPRLRFPGGADLRSYAVWSSMRQERMRARVASRDTGTRFDPMTMDGDDLRWRISKLGPAD